MIEHLCGIRNKREKLAVGLMSGTSVDGIDAALTKVRGHGEDAEVELVKFISYPHPEGLKERILSCSAPGSGSVGEVCRLNTLLGEIFADAALAVIDEAGVPVTSIDFIGSHGQTVHHLPRAETLFGHKVRATLQLGEPSVIAARTGILTVADFRPADMAHGGQGAPLVAYFDYVVFRSSEQSRALINLGGIANFTILKKGCSLHEVLAYDTGPANMVVDCLVLELFSQPFDQGGSIAQAGKVSAELLEFALDHPYFAQTPPKSTGREEFGARYSQTLLVRGRQLGLSSEDIITTAAELTLQTIWQSYQKEIARDVCVDEFIISGGGAKNEYMMARLAELAAGAAVRPIDDYGIPYDAKEAICFALLANETLCGLPSNVPAATGAKAPAILGKICF